MRKFLFIFFVFLSCVCTAQIEIKSPKQDVDIIKVKKYNIEKEIKNGSLSFLKGAFWTESIKKNGKIVSITRANTDALIGRRGVVYIEKIKKQNPDGSFTNLPPKKIIIE